MKEQMETLEIIRNEVLKIKEKYQKKAEKERAKVNEVYVTIQGEKCYTEEEINDWYAGDYITLKQCDRYIEKLEQKQEKAGQKDYQTKSERVVSVLNDIVSNLSCEIEGIKVREEEKKKRQERLEIAQKQGLSYQQWLELEEISRQSEEYERIHGI